MELDHQTSPIYDLDISFPPLPRTVAKVSEILAGNGVPDTEQLIEVVHHDPLVVASVLKRINSAYYGMRRKFDDLRKAVVMIGFIEVSNIVLASGYVGLRKLGTSKDEQRIIDRILRTSIGAGFFTNVLAQELNLPGKSTAFTLGLLHSVGRLVLLHNHPDVYTELFRRSGDAFLPSAEEERDMLGIDHLTLGSVAARYWNFPDLIPQLIESYQTPGHLETASNRRMAMALNTGIDVTRQLEDLLAGYSAGGKDIEMSPEAFDGLPFPLSLKFAKPLHQLARDVECPVDNLKTLINDTQAEGLKYIEHMVKL